MAVIQIPNLPAAIALNGQEQLEAVQAGTTVRVTSAQIAGFAESTINGVINVMDYGAVCNGINEDTAAVNQANIAALAENKQLYFPGPCRFIVPITITAAIFDTYNQIFAVGSNITINNGSFIRPDWWGDVAESLNYAVAALPASGGVVKLLDKTYKPNYHKYGYAVPSSAKYFSKPNVTIEGSKMPRLANDCRSLVGGTIIQGQILAWADNFEIKDCGIDVGYTVCQTYNGGPNVVTGWADALMLTWPDDATKASGAVKLSGKVHNVVGLCYSPTIICHAMLLGEGYDNITGTGNLIACYGAYGFIVKCGGAQIDSMTAICNGADGVIIRSGATAAASDIQIGKIYVNKLGLNGWSPYTTDNNGVGVDIDALFNILNRVQISQIISENYKYGVIANIGATQSVQNLQIGSVYADCSNSIGFTTAGFYLSINAGAELINSKIGNVIVKNAAAGVLYNINGTISNPYASINSISVENITDVAVQSSGKTNVSIGSISAKTVTAGVFRLTSTGKIYAGILNVADAGCPLYASTSGGLTPSFATGWSQSISGDTFLATLIGGRVNLQGLVAPGGGATTTVATLPYWARPLQNKRFIVQGYNGVTQDFVPVVVTPAGAIVINEVSGGTANCTTWLSLDGCSWALDV